MRKPMVFSNNALTDRTAFLMAVRSVFLLSCILFTVLWGASLSHAQSFGGNNRVFSDDAQALSITDEFSFYNLLEKAVVYEDENGKEDLQSIRQSFRAGKKGDVQASEILNLSYKNSAYWIVFELKNEVDRMDWVVDFGNIATGKSGVFQKYYFYNMTMDRVIFDSSKPFNPKNSMQPVTGTSVAFTLRPDHKNIFIMYVQPSDSMPLTFPMTLRAADQEAKIDPLAYFSRTYFYLMLGGGIIFLAGISMFKGGWVFLPLVVVMTLKYMWYWLQDSFIISPQIVIDWAPAAYITITSIMAILASWLFNNLKRKEDDGSLVLVIVSSIVLFAFLMYAFIFPEGTVLRSVALYIPYLITFLSIAFYAFGQHAMGVHGAKFMGITWLIWLSGIIIHFMAVAGFLPMSVWVIQAEWYVLGAILVSMMWAVSGRFEGLMQEAVQNIIRKAQKAQSLSKLKQSKESADQARLLRVIEREREIMEELRQRESQRTEEMRQAKIAADEANNAKSAFLAVVSHEIRTPMTGVMGMVRLMYDTPLTQDQSDYLQTIKDSGDAMLALLNDILDFSKIEGGGMELEIVDFDLQRMIDGVIRLMSGHASQKNIYVKADTAADLPRYIKGDPTRLRQVMLNFVGNAIKFTAEGGVTLHVYKDPDHPGVYERPNDIPLKFVVEDTGIGISEEGQKNLFTPFAQADSSIARKFGGTGLGLAICKRLVEAMGAKIELKSVEGQGTKFFFTLMVEAGSVEQSDAGGYGQTDMALMENQAQLTILIVDDNEINRKVIQGLITKYGHKTALAENARDAIALAEYNHFDLILMDIELPDMNGDEATKIIRNNEKIQIQPYIAALTGNVQQEHVDHYLASGMDSCLAKPIEPEKLEEVMLYVSGQKESENEQAVTPASDEGQAENANAGLDEHMDVPLSDKDDTSASMLVGSEMSEQNTIIEKDISAMNTHADPQIIVNEVPVSETMSIQNRPDAQSEEHEEHEEQAVDVADAISAEARVAEEISQEERDAIFDEPMLAGLKDAMGKDQIEELLGPLFDKNDELVAAMIEAHEAGDWKILSERAHEMKGMNGNFGLKKMGEIGSEIEALGRADVTDSAAYKPHIDMLTEAKDRSRVIVEQWMNS